MIRGVDFSAAYQAINRRTSDGFFKPDILVCVFAGGFAFVLSVEKHHI